MLKGKTALVTGSTSGIGLGIAKALARQGANIVMNGFGDVDGPKKEIEALGVKAAYHGADMSKPAEIEEMMKFAAAMKAANWGRIINVASAHGLVASPQKSAYVASKHGIVGFTKSVALETATTGITSNAICPGWVLTPLVQKQIDARAEREGLPVDQAKRELLAEKEPSLQFTTPDELGELAVFFCSDAAKNVRGVAWNMDGGWVAQ
jgi:3-hydroxybutyrate dehydrogenase